MTIEKINQWIKEAHNNAVEKGFYDCPDCEDGYEYDSPEYSGGQPLRDKCKTCNGTGINQNKNIGELLMLVTTELNEAVEAHRCGQFTDYDGLPFDDFWCGISEGSNFEECIKDTFEDEIADSLIRCFALMGYCGFGYNTSIRTNLIKWKSENTAQKIRQVCKYFDNIDEDNLTDIDLIRGVKYLLQLSRSFNIPIEKHIDAKMAYNKTRPRKHNKEY